MDAKLIDAVIILAGSEQADESLEAERNGFIKEGRPVIEILGHSITLWIPDEDRQRATQGKLYMSYAHHLSVIVPLRVMEQDLRYAPKTPTA